MFEPIRGGTRGGQAEFKWSDVSADKDRENYLGHSINAPTGRWQKNKDVHWYNRDLAQTETERQIELRKIKEAEEDAIAAALGLPPPVRHNVVASSNIPSAGPSTTPGGPTDVDAQEKEEKKLKKLEKKARKAEKRARKEKDREHRDDRSGSNDPRRAEPRGRRSRSRSPMRSGLNRSALTSAPRPRSRTPTSHRSNVASRHVETRYDRDERERERERDRRRWEENARRDEPGGFASRRR